MRVLITGATGFVGRALVKELLVKGIEILVVIREKGNIPDWWKKERKIDIIYGDLNDLNLIYFSVPMDRKVDIFYHLGWYGTSGKERTDIDGQLQNVKNTCNAIKLAYSLGCSTFVNAGSIMEYEIIKLMSSGNYVPGLSSIYSIAKLSADYMGRTLANSLGIKYINVIISNIYGVGEKSGRFLNTIVRKMLKNEEISLTHGNQLYDFIYITDAVKMICMVGSLGHNNVNYYIGNSKQRPLKEFLLEMKTVLNSSSKLKFGAVSLDSPSITYQEFDTNIIEKEFKIKPEFTFSQGIEKMKEWIVGGENE